MRQGIDQERGLPTRAAGSPASPTAGAVALPEGNGNESGNRKAR